jgi:hypothetical protein
VIFFRQKYRQKKSGATWVHRMLTLELHLHNIIFQKGNPGGGGFDHFTHWLEILFTLNSNAKVNN